MKSMTGYGWSECSQDGFKVTAELSSVNRKQGEISLNLPRELEVLEAQIRDEINRVVARGRVNVRVALHMVEGKEALHIHLNKRLAEAYAKEMSALARDLKLSSPVTLELLMRAPGVLQTDHAIADAEDFWPAVQKSVKVALKALVVMREREGKSLQVDLSKRVSTMRRAVSRIQRRAPLVLKRYRGQLMDRVKTAGLDPSSIDDDRVYKEIVLFADRSDISEELTRLQSHFEQFDSYVKSREPVGRTLDFLAQEMHREINTIGSKANDSQIAQQVVVLKTELEKFREQTQNIE
jgi:uncharacterized protein (TIGR00255 family)